MYFHILNVSLVLFTTVQLSETLLGRQLPIGEYILLEHVYEVFVCHFNDVFALAQPLEYSSLVNSCFI